MTGAHEPQRFALGSGARNKNSDVGTRSSRAYRSKMPDEASGIPLADILRAPNELVSAGLIKDYALGGALAAIYDAEPFTTYDADIILSRVTKV